jgi:hypothetical protein
VEELCDDDAIFVGHVYAGVRDAFEEGSLAPNLIVQDVVAANNLGIDVGEQAEGDALFLAEFAENFLIVVRNGVELDAGGFELSEGIAQLTELRPTRGSPDRRSVEDDDRLRLATTRVVVNEVLVRVRQLKAGKTLADLRARRVPVRKARTTGVSKRSRSIEAVVVALDRHVVSSWARYPVPSGREPVPGLEPWQRTFIER